MDLCKANVDCFQEYTFIDGTRMEQSQPWRLSNGRPINYAFDWAAGEPNNPNREFCLSVYGRDSNVYGMNDLSCDRPSKFICEEITDYAAIDFTGSGLTVTYNDAGVS